MSLLLKKWRICYKKNNCISCDKQCLTFIEANDKLNKMATQGTLIACQETLNLFFDLALAKDYAYQILKNRDLFQK